MKVLATKEHCSVRVHNGLWAKEASGRGKVGSQALVKPAWV